jgi:hypothetical protein
MFQRAAAMGSPVVAAFLISIENVSSRLNRESACRIALAPRQIPGAHVDNFHAGGMRGLNSQIAVFVDQALVWL